MLADFKVHHETVHIQKEAEGHESPGFKALFKGRYPRNLSNYAVLCRIPSVLGEQTEPSGPSTETPPEIDVNARRMFIIEEKAKNVLHFKEVNNTCTTTSIPGLPGG